MAVRTVQRKGRVWRRPVVAGWYVVIVFGERVLNNAGVERLLEKERRLGTDIAFSDIAEEVGGVYPRVMKDGDLDAGAWSCGMVAGLIHDIPAVGELIGRIMHQAEEIVAQRLQGMLLRG